MTTELRDRPMAAIFRDSPGSSEVSIVALRTLEDWQELLCGIADTPLPCPPVLVNEEELRAIYLDSRAAFFFKSPAQFLPGLAYRFSSDDEAKEGVANPPSGRSAGLPDQPQDTPASLWSSAQARASRAEAQQADPLMRACKFQCAADLERIKERITAAHDFPDMPFDMTATYGCFYCGRVFPGTAFLRGGYNLNDLTITRYISCPCCGMDALLSPACGEAITPDLLFLMTELWFNEWDRYAATFLMETPATPHPQDRTL